MINRSRNLFSLKNKQYVFTGFNEASILLAKDLIRTKDDISVLFLLPYMEIKNSELFEQLDGLGFIIMYVSFDDNNMFKISDKQFEKWRACFFIENDEDINIKMALKFIRRLNEAKFQKDMEIDIYIRAETEDMELLFTDKADYLHLHVFNQSDITARQFVLAHPMLKAPETECSENNILILGFGHIGIELLKKSICDAQYSDKQLSVTIIDEQFDTHYSDFLFRCSEAIEKYNIVFNPNDINYARSKRFFSWLLEKRNNGDVLNLISFNRIFVALGDSRLNIDVAQTICDLRRKLELVNSKDVIFAHVHETDSYNYFDENNENRKISIFGNSDKIYTVDVVINETIDAIAKAINYEYSKEDYKNDKEAWRKATIYDQNSSRAAAAGRICRLS